MRYYSALLLFICVILLSSCKDEPGQPLVPGRFSFGLNGGDIGSSEAGRQKDNQENLTKVLVTIENSNGELVHDLEELTLLKLDDDFISEELALMPGMYRITKFFVADGDNNILYATPIEGSLLADIVEHPLPVEFTVTSSEVNNIVMEVVSVEEAEEPDDFGYATFSLVFVKPDIALGITATIADEDFTGPVDFTLEAEAKNTEGDIVWEYSWDMTDHGTISIPSHYHSYTFKTVKAGQLPHVQHYLASDFPGNDELFFEMIPENSDDFIIHEMYDGKVKIYFPADRTKIYARVELAEDFRIQYLWLDKDSGSLSGVPLGQLAWTEVNSGDHPMLNGNEKLIRHAVNVYDNIPFTQAGDFREYINMDLSSFTKDFDRDVSIYAFILIDDTTNDFETSIFDWDFDYEARRAYWCEHAGVGCDETSGEAGRVAEFKERTERARREM